MALPDPPPLPPPASVRRRRALGAALVLIGASLFVMLLARIVGPKPIPAPQVIHYTPRQAADAHRDFEALGSQLLTPSPTPPVPPQTRTPTSGGPEASPPARRAPTAAIPIRLQLSEADLNTYLATDPKVKALLASRGVGAVQLFLRAPHTVTCRAAVLYKGHRTNIQITGDLLPDRDAVARFVATHAQAGALPLPPKFVTAQADRIAGQFLGRVRGRVPVTVRDIRVVGDRLILTGVRRPTPGKPPPN